MTLKCEKCGKISMAAVDQMWVTSLKYRLLTLPPDQFCYGHQDAKAPR